MFEVDQGLGPQWPAHRAPSLEPGLGLRPAHNAGPEKFYPHNAGKTRSRAARRRALIASLLVMTAAGGLWTRLNTGPVIGSSGFKAQLDTVARATGFAIDMVVLTGHRFTPDSEIFDALDLPNARSLVSFDTEGVRRRLERLPWVLTADLTRVFPDRLDVRVSERKAYAVWMHDNHAQLIDASGRILSAINRGDGLGLPRVSGQGAPQEAERFLSVLARNSDVYARLEDAERVGERRWTLHLSGAVTVHLPPDGEAAALETLSHGGRLAQLLSVQNRIVDLRASGRVAVRQAGPG